MNLRRRIDRLQDRYADRCDRLRRRAELQARIEAALSTLDREES